MKSRLLLLPIVCLISGCSWFESDTPAPRPSPVASTPVAHAPESHEEIPGTTMADRKLQRIYEKQQRVMNGLTEDPDDYSQAERDRLMDNLLSEYQTFTFENPNYVYGYILYGKLLRQVGDREAANIAFAKANQLDPGIAVVKQQMGNYFAEEGDWEAALMYFSSAKKLDPTNALYRYQIGELLYYNQKALVEGAGMPKQEFDGEMLQAFGDAARMDPGNRSFQMRYAEAFFDVNNPDWDEALTYWNTLEATSSSDLERAIIRLQKVRIYIEQGRYDNARALLILVDEPGMEFSKQQLLERIPAPAASGN